MAEIPEGSSRVVYAALAGNALEALAKFIAAAVSGSSAMLTEAIHSTADCANQILLLVGQRRSKAPADDTHNFGYGGEIYFWTFVVAVFVLAAGGGFAIFEGVHQIRNPEPLKSALVTYIVLILSAIFETGSLWVGIREYKRMVARHPGDGKPVGLWRFIVLSKDPLMYESLLEDVAALIGIGIAAVGVTVNLLFGLLWADGCASILIGVLLIADAGVVLLATKSLIAGEAVAPPLLKDMHRALAGHRRSFHIGDIATLHLGPEMIAVTLTISNGGEGCSFSELKSELDQAETLLRAVDPRIAIVNYRFEDARS